jgi:hypothetical protein
MERRQFTRAFNRSVNYAQVLVPGVRAAAVPSQMFRKRRFGDIVQT